MSDATTAIIDLVVSKATVTTELAAEKFCRDWLPQGIDKNSLPCCIVSQINTNRGQHTINCGLPGLARSRVEFEVFALTREEANRIARAIAYADGVVNFTGEQSGVYIRGITLDDIEEYFEPPRDGEQLPRFITTVDFIVHFREPS